jgi:hypothetical protein
MRHRPRRLQVRGRGHGPAATAARSAPGCCTARLDGFKFFERLPTAILPRE